MENGNQTKANRILNRRQYLAGASALSLGLAGIQPVHAESGTTEIVVARDSDGPRITRRVPAAWYTQLQHVKEQTHSLRNQLSDVSGVSSVGIGNAESAIDGLREKQIEVQLSGEDVSVDIPEQVNGVTVSVEENTNMEYTADDLNGGEEFHAFDFSGTSKQVRPGSICIRTYKNGYGPYGLTARHTFTKYGEPGTKIDAPNVSDAEPTKTTDKIGHHVGGAGKHDAAWFEITESSHYLTPDPVNWVETIEGWVTESGLHSFASGGDTIYFRGKTTGSETYTVDSCCCEYSQDNLVDLVTYDGPATQSGDSGGIFFWSGGTADGEAWLCGLLSGNKIVDSKSNRHPTGAAGFAMNRDHGLDYT